MATHVPRRGRSSLSPAPTCCPNYTTHGTVARVNEYTAEIRGPDTDPKGGLVDPA